MINNMTKLEELIELCMKGAPKESCKECVCNEKECLECLIEAYNSFRNESLDING